LKQPTRANPAARPTRKPLRCATLNTISTISISRDVTEVWRRGALSCIWLLDLTAISLLEQPALERSPAACPTLARPLDHPRGHRIDGAAPVLSASLYQRFTSSGEDDFEGKSFVSDALSFGGHVEKKTGTESFEFHSAPLRLDVIFMSLNHWTPTHPFTLCDGILVRAAI